ncbi:hypothetical protein MTR_5g078870 [Medicago truncatula]|uniref:Uncharacterized protein n=1 Tax=Medicago truncatula TaxID=3880 RepID=G7K1V0_MEDTR|nr:hypothetical protein MTR_5g078870 [Medicago truncatula]
MSPQSQKLGTARASIGTAVPPSRAWLLEEPKSNSNQVSEIGLVARGTKEKLS